MCSEQENRVESMIFYPSSSGLSQSDSERWDEESRDYQPSNSHEKQSEDDSEYTDGFDRFTDHQVHPSTSRQWIYVCLVWHLRFSFSY